MALMCRRCGVVVVGSRRQFCPACRKARHLEAKRRWLKVKANFEKHQEAARCWYKAHPDYQAKWRKAHPEKCQKYNRRFGKQRRDRELIIIAQVHGDDVPRCRADLTPGLGLLCRGGPQVDHINGKGRLDKGRQLRVIIGTYFPLDDLRILCQLHQYEYAILRRAFRSEARFEDWEDP